MKKAIIALVIIALAGFTYFQTDLFNSPGKIIANPAPEAALANVPLESIEMSNELWLVNGEHPIDAAKSKGITSLSGATSRALETWFGAASLVNIADFFIVSGYRTRKEQEQLYNEAMDKRYVARPDTSEHQIGLAVDIAATNVSGADLTDSTEGKWLKKTAWENGFILRYPEGKEHITGVAYEPWHFRYVGVPHAYYCYKESLTLEEYVILLRSGYSYQMRLQGKDYWVYHTTVENGSIEVPKDLPYQVSEDNAGGYIVTVQKR